MWEGIERNKNKKTKNESGKLSEQKRRQVARTKR